MSVLRHNKYIICLPTGGFNDCMCQIEETWQYAARHNRILVIHTNRNFCALHDTFSHYFVTCDSDVATLTPELKCFFNTLTAYPYFFNGNMDMLEEEFVFESQAKFFFHKNTGARFVVNLDEEYHEELLIKVANGGGDSSIHAMGRLVFTRNVKSAIRKKLRLLPAVYDAIHIRNTDIRTDFLNFFQTIYQQVKGKNLLICTDDWQTREIAKKFFIESNVYTLNDYVNPEGRSLHRITRELTDMAMVRQLNIVMLTELVALARSQRLHLSGVLVDGVHKPPAGFSRLARNLQQRPDILEHLFAS